MLSHDVTGRLSTALAGRYRVLRQLGEGGMAIVYLAEDVKHQREVALKLLRPELAPELGTERFLREIRLTAQLVHPNILPVLDSGEADGLLFYVMPLVRGATLRVRLERERQLPVDTAIRITEEVASALSHAHAHGILHRDVKPENILFADDHALLADFGIARPDAYLANDVKTVSGVALGTPAYMSPEQSAPDGSVDARSDLYALASVT
ncbi:MAG TPA: serine/threonine-protein kinase [Gemmatimonadales bacterium]|nr:serine/threonine-protein kinase [Gemmatimonadales bacterium]